MIDLSAMAQAFADSYGETAATAAVVFGLMLAAEVIYWSGYAILSLFDRYR